MKLIRRRATSEDIPFLLKLRHQTMDRHLLASGARADEADHVDRLMYRFDCAEVLIESGVPIGLLKISRDELDWKVIQIQFVPEQQGKGYGARLLKEAIAEAQAAGATLKLSVLKANPAKTLDERLGFLVEGEGVIEYNMRYQA